MHHCGNCRCVSQLITVSASFTAAVSTTFASSVSTAFTATTIPSEWRKLSATAVRLRGCHPRHRDK